MARYILLLVLCTGMLANSARDGAKTASPDENHAIRWHQLEGEWERSGVKNLPVYRMTQNAYYIFSVSYENGWLGARQGRERVTTFYVEGQSPTWPWKMSWQPICYIGNRIDPPTKECGLQGPRDVMIITWYHDGQQHWIRDTPDRPGSVPNGNGIIDSWRDDKGKQAVIQYTIWAGSAQAAQKPSTVTLHNNSQKPLYVYYAFAKPQGAIPCEQLRFDQLLPHGKTSSLTAPPGQFGWVRLQLEKGTNGCDSSKNKWEAWPDNLRGDGQPHDYFIQ
jgi:hypothetical protein